MIKIVILLAALGFVQARPNEDADLSDVKLHEPHPDCPPAEIHFLLPHETDCTKFYYCEYGLKFIEPTSCAPGTAFSFQNQTCVHPWDADCDLSPAPPTTATPTAAPVTTTTLDLVTTTAAPVTTLNPEEFFENGCPRDLEKVHLLPHESECTKFYYCVLGTKVERECPNGLYFNIDIEDCDLPSNVVCGEHTPTTTAAPISEDPCDPPVDDENSEEIIVDDPPIFLENGCPQSWDIHYLLPHEDDCTKFYYCVFGEKVERQCPDNLYFNYDIQVCDWPWNVTCNNNVGGEPSTTTAAPVTETPSPVTTLNPEDFFENGCPRDLEKVHLLPHESDCSKFYYCVLGTKVERECQNGLYFNIEIEDCDLPSNVDCGEHTPTTAAAPISEDPCDPPVDDENSEEIIVDDPPIFLENGCPQSWDIHYLLPHEDDCTKFYYCVFGEKVERQCPDNLYFNYDIQVCDWPWNVTCNNNVGGEPSTTTAAPVTEAPFPVTTLNPEEFFENGCPRDLEKVHLLPHESECTKFYYCVFGTKVERECQNGLYFNIEIEDCDLPSNVACGEHTSTPTAAPISEDPCDPPVDDENSEEIIVDDPPIFLENGCPQSWDIHYLLPHEDDCTKFYYCVFGEKVERQCPDNLYFNYDIQVCDWPWNVTCNNNVGTDPSTTTAAPVTETPSPVTTLNPEDFFENGCPRDLEKVHLLPHESECTKFYYCVFGTKVERECQNGLYFNIEIEDCDLPSNVACGEHTSTTTAAPISEDPCDPPVDDENSEEIIVDDPPIFLENGCPQSWDIHYLLPHEDDCTKFYYCVFGEKVERQCPDNLYFNYDIQVCDWPWNVTCNNNGGGSGGSDPPTITAAPVTEAPCDPPVDDENSEEIIVDDPPIFLENGCPQSWDIHYLLPHEDDCTKFYYCVFGEKVKRQCPDNLYFNYDIQVCDWPWNVTCSNNGGGGGGSDPTTTTAPVTEAPFDPPVDEESSDEIIPDDPNNPCNACNVTPWAHETDCDKYWFCNDKQPQLVTCSLGLFYNPNSFTCDFVCNAGCTVDGIERSCLTIT